MESRLPRRKILIVEDDGVSRQLLNRLLAKSGYETFMVSTGGQALSFVTRCEVDLILMDVMLPDIDGLSVSAAIRDRERQNNRVRIPMVAITALKLNERECLKAGIDAYLQKPALPDQLLAVVQQFVRINVAD